MDLGLKGKHVLVTGSSRGIGNGIAQGFLEEGANVVLSSRKTEDLEKLKSKYTKLYPESHILTYACDFTHPKEVFYLKQQISRVWDHLDVVVANIGNGRGLQDPIPPQKHFEETMGFNFDSAVYTAREFYPLLEISKGSLLFITSIAGLEAFGAPVDYAVAKTAMIAFSKNLARKVAVDGVRVNCIAPGNIYFEGGSWDEKMQSDPERINQLIATTVPMQRFGNIEEIADAALFLSSKRATFITGTVLRVDGGQTTGLF